VPESTRDSGTARFPDGVFELRVGGVRLGVVREDSTARSADRVVDDEESVSGRVAVPGGE
jgi:hypothetical protein